MPKFTTSSLILKLDTLKLLYNKNVNLKKELKDSNNPYHEMIVPSVSLRFQEKTIELFEEIIKEMKT